MKVLIFGGTGFLGQALVKVFDATGIEYAVVSRTKIDTGFSVDISNYDDFDRLPRNAFDVVINCATVLPGGDYLDSEYLDKIYKTNILGTQNICKWIASQSTIRHIINCSTLVVISKPWDIQLSEDACTYPSGGHVLYCSSKLTQELIFKTFAESQSMTLCQLRFSALYGERMPWNGIICNLIDQAKLHKEITLVNGNKLTVDFLYIEDAARIILSAIKAKYNGILNAASGEETSLYQLASLIAQHSIDDITVLNSDCDSVPDNRANINMEKLNHIVNSSNFTSIQEGIQKMMLV